MRVLAGPRLDPAIDPLSAAICRRLAGEGGSVISLADLGLRNPYRPVSRAEVQALRGALRGHGGVIGYVCRGARFGTSSRPGAPEAGAGLVAVSDHVNLTWRSPLVGPNDEAAGPRFPSLSGLYATEKALALGDEQDGMIVVPGVVAGVPDDRALSGYAVDMAGRLGWLAASSELVAPVIIAAHMGIRVAAVVMTG
jgi:hypothetical protein